LIGLGIAGLIRASVCAALGEARHHKGLVNIQGNIYRNTVYKKYFENVFDGIKRLQVTEKIFSQGSWNDSYGGKNWSSCTRATIKLVNKAISFVRKPTEENFQKLMAQFNILINEVHNGGKFLNKFVSNNTFDLAAADIALFVGRNADKIYEFIKLTKDLDSKEQSLSGMKKLIKMNKKDIASLTAILEAEDSHDSDCCEDNDEDDCEE
jgi:hypothetical protein